MRRQEDDGVITECVKASRGQVEARFLARWAQHMDVGGTVVQTTSRYPWKYDDEIRNAFQEAYVDWVAACIEPPSQHYATQALLVLPKLFVFPEYTDLKVRDAATECQKICTVTC